MTSCLYLQAVSTAATASMTAVCCLSSVQSTRVNDERSHNVIKPPLRHAKGYSSEQYMYSVSQKNPPPTTAVFLTFSNGWEFLYQLFLHTYTFLSMLDYKFLFNYLQVWRSYAILSETTHQISYISLELNFQVCLLSNWRHCWRHVISSMFVDIIKAADLEWLATDNDQQSYQWLSQTSELWLQILTINSMINR